MLYILSIKVNSKSQRNISRVALFTRLYLKFTGNSTKLLFFYRVMWSKQVQQQSQWVHSVQGKGMWMRNVRQPQQRYKAIETWNRVKRATKWILNLNLPTFISHMLINCDPNGRKKVKYWFIMIQRTNRSITSSIPETSI